MYKCGKGVVVSVEHLVSFIAAVQKQHFILLHVFDSFIIKIYECTPHKSKQV